MKTSEKKENNWGREDQNAAYYEGIRRSDEMNHLEDKLSGMGYHFMIEKNGSEIYSNLSEMDVEALMELGGEAVYSADTLTASRNDISIVKNTFYHGDKTFCILAVRREQADQGMVNYLQHYILRYIAGIAVFFVLLTLIVNSILSWWISRSILKPLNLLKDGSCRIREGDLYQKIQYNKKDITQNKENIDKNKNPKFSENTDFDKIINGNEEYFYVTDLKKYKQTHEYRNSNEHVDIYNGTIVVPIKIRNEYIHFSTEKSNEYNLLGFLCVDSESNRAFTQRQKQYNLQIMFIFANIFYMILNKYKYYLNKYKNEYERKG